MSDTFSVDLAWCGTRQLTKSGGYLQINSDNVTHVELRLQRLASPCDDFPIDALSTEIDLCDRDGRVWTATSTVTSDLFVRHMFDLSFSDNMSLHRLETAPAVLLARLDTQIRVTGLRSSQDDRAYRQLIFRDGDDIELVPVFFKYVSFEFDIAGIGHDLTVRVNERQPSALVDKMTNEDVGAFLFQMHTCYLLRNNAILENNVWRENPFPQSLIFELTDRSGIPQRHVCAS